MSQFAQSSENNILLQRLHYLPYNCPYRQKRQVIHLAFQRSKEWENMLIDQRYIKIQYCCRRMSRVRLLIFASYFLLFSIEYQLTGLGMNPSYQFQDFRITCFDLFFFCIYTTCSKIPKNISRQDQILGSYSIIIKQNKDYILRIYDTSKTINGQKVSVQKVTRHRSHSQDKK